MQRIPILKANSKVTLEFTRQISDRSVRKYLQIAKYCMHITVAF